MKRVQEIKARRERAFWKNRMASKSSIAKTFAATEIGNHIELVRPKSKAAGKEMDQAEKDRIREKIRVAAKKRLETGKASKLIPSEGRSMGMGMEVDA